MLRNPRHPIFLAVAALLSAIVVGLIAQPARGASPWQAIRYNGEEFQVPSWWPVYDLVREPTACVRFDRHAVYEGAAGPHSDCPSRVVGVSEAVQVQPVLQLAEHEDSAKLRSTNINGQQALVSTNDEVTHRLVAVFPRSAVLVTISYRSDRSLAEEVLDSFAATGTGTTSTKSGTSVVPSAGSPEQKVSRTTATSVARTLFTGIGFDTCQAPTEQQMAAWKAASPYGAIGVYIGGVNAACTNITGTWVQEESNAGWYLFPLYVGLQSPCADQQGLAEINPKYAWSEGIEAAEDAANQAESFDMGAGATIYYDMEAWDTQSSSCNTAVNTFTVAWTNELHEKRYGSGFYSSADAGINQVIVPMYGHPGAPDDIDIGQWDGSANTSSIYVPVGDWANHQRIKQYNGDVTRTYGGVTLQIDQDYLDAPTVGDPRPSVTGVFPSSSAVGTVVTVTGTGFAPGATTVRFGSLPGGSVSVTGSTRLTVNVPPQAPATVNVTVTTGGGTSGAKTFTYVPFVGMAVDPATGGYWLVTSKGNVYGFNAPFYGSTAYRSLPAPVVGIAATGTGYLLVTSKGNVYTYHTAFHGSTVLKRLPAPVVGASALPDGGYYLATSKGNVYSYDAPFYGSTVLRKLPAPVVGIATTGTGYLLVTSKGNVYTYHTAFHGSTVLKRLPAPVVGASALPDGGYYLPTSKGNVYSYDAPFYGSAWLTSLPAPVVGMAVTSAGYVLTTAAGNAYTYHTTWYGSMAARG